MQRFVDNILGVAQESIKTFCQESFNNTVKLINGLSALLLAILPGKTTILEGIQGWELQPTLRAPWLPRWMEEGVSSFNQIIHEYAADSDPEIESEHESGFEDNDSAIPSSPSSQTSHLCRASRLRLDRQSSQSSLFKQFVSGAFWHLRHLFGIGQSNHHLSTGSGRRHTTVTSSHRHSDSSGSLTRMYDLASKGFTSMKEYMVHHTTDRRRGVIEDLQLIVELFIEGVFDMLRNVLFYIFSPFEVVNLILGTLIFQEQKTLDEFTVQTATLGNSDPIPSLQQSRFRQAMNTDARTCEDIITELGYPYEALRVLTADGYILLMERIPRPESQKVLYLQHGLLDSSLGWVSNGVVGSQAFSAYDQGYDVFLGNLRGLASREHLDKNISSQRYWRYSVNEHGTMDIPAMLNKIHEIKVAELEHLQIAKEGRVGCTTISQQPYTLCGIAHSLGGAAMLIYVVTRRLEGKPHCLSRLILLSPAGFHEDAPIVCGFIQYVFPALAPLLTPIIPGLYIPTKFFRMLFNKLARDFQNYPALGGLVQTLCGYIVGGDSSNWIEAIGQTHYNIYDMPGVAYRVIIHLAQMRRANRFMLYDFGSISANMEAYGTSYPLDIGANYGVIDIPVDLVAGRKDKLIPKSNVKRHYQLLKERGCQVSYEENEYAHLDYTFKHREELLEYIMSRLLLVTPPESADSFHKPRKHSFGHGRSQGRREAKRLKGSKYGKALKPKDKDIVDELTIIGTPDIQGLASPTTSPSLKELAEGSFGQPISTNNRTMLDGAIQSNTDVFLDDSSIFSLSAKDVALAFSNSSSISNLSKLFKPGA